MSIQQQFSWVPGPDSSFESGVTTPRRSAEKMMRQVRAQRAKTLKHKHVSLEPKWLEPKWSQHFLSDVHMEGSRRGHGGVEEESRRRSRGGVAEGLRRSCGGAAEGPRGNIPEKHPKERAPQHCPTPPNPQCPQNIVHSHVLALTTLQHIQTTSNLCTRSILAQKQIMPLIPPTDGRLCATNMSTPDNMSTSHDIPLPKTKH